MSRGWKRSGAAAAAVLLGVVALLSGCAKPRTLDVTDVVLVPPDSQPFIASSTGREPYRLASGVAGKVRVFFTADFRPGVCILTMDGVRTLPPLRTMSAEVEGDYVTYRSYYLTYDTGGLAAFREITGSLECWEEASDGGGGTTTSDKGTFGKTSLTDRFTVASRPIIFATIEPTSVEFASTQVGQSRPKPVMITSLGGLPFTVGSPSVTGAGAAAYSVDASGCTAAAVPSTGRCDLWVTFRPSSAGTLAARMTVTLRSADPANSDEVTLSVELSGTATPEPTPTPTPQPQDPHHPPTG